MVPGSAVGSAKQLKPVTISAVANFAVDHNATDAIAETYYKHLMDKFLWMGTKSGGWTPATSPHWSRSSTSRGHKVVPNRYLYAKICMILEETTEGEYIEEHHRCFG